MAARTGGPPIQLVNSSAPLAAHGVELTVYTTDSARPASAKPFERLESRDELPPGHESCDIRVFPTGHPHRFAFSAALLRELGRTVRQFDLVRIHSLYLFPSLAAGVQCRRHGVPYVVLPHGTYDPVIRQGGRARKEAQDVLWQRRLLRGAALLHFTTEDEAKLAFQVIDEHPYAVVANGVDFERFSRVSGGAAFRERHLGGHRGPVVVMTGRISHKKGIDLLVRALAQLSARPHDVHLAIVGPDDEGLTDGLRTLARESGVERRVHFVGALYAAELDAAIDAAEVWALPSRGENFGNAVVEALAAGKAVLTSTAVNIAADLEAAGAAMVVPPEVEAVRDGLERLLGDDALRQRFADRGQRHARRYDQDEVAGALATMFEEVVGSAEPVTRTISS